MSSVASPTFEKTITQQDISITPTARSQLAALVQQAAEDDIEAEGIRVYVSGGGCSGMTYGMTFTDQETPYDTVLEEDGIKVYVDAVALNYLRGVEIDYVDRPMGASFVFNNVFATTGGSGTCGRCGMAGGGGCG